MEAGARLRLSSQPFQILEVLLSRPGDLITREELQKRLWPEDTFVDFSHGLNAAVNKLRDTLSDSADDPKYIETLPRRGYRFIGRVEAAAPAMSAEAPKPEVFNVNPVPVQAGNLERGEEHGSRSRSSRLRTLFAVSVAMFFVAAALMVWILVGGHGAAFFGLADTKKDEKPWIEYPASKEREQIEEAKPNARLEQGERGLVVVPAAESGDGIPRALVRRRAPNLRQTVPTQRIIVSGNGGNAAPQFSPDGKRIAFMSNRSGSWQIWVSSADGSNPMQVSFTESGGTPRWSPDGRSIAFDGPLRGRTHIYVVRVDSREMARPLVEGLVPSFSRDGKWVYFASDRSGEWQVWKVTVTGGSAQQLTREGGFAALESSDGYLYYSKSRYPNPEIWRVSITGGEEQRVSPRLIPRTWSAWAVTTAGILFVEDLPDGKSVLSLYVPAKRQVHDMVALYSPPFWMGASADGKRAVINDAAERQIVMVENFR